MSEFGALKAFSSNYALGSEGFCIFIFISFLGFICCVLVVDSIAHMDSLFSYLKSPIITILVGSGESQTSLSAHLALLQSSPWFTDACASYTAATPPNERIVELIDDDIEAVGAFLEYLYTREYAPRLVPGSSGRAEEMVLEETADNDVDEGGEHLLKHAKVYTLAGKLRLPELKSLAHSKIHRINSTAKGELRYAKFVYENTTPDDKTIRQPIASFWAHRSAFIFFWGVLRREELLMVLLCRSCSPPRGRG